jgi:lipopolysaccharide/colanic/teichoic acid biosynthesis glycosyltransferase
VYLPQEVFNLIRMLYRKRIKLILDILIAGVVFCVLLPVFIIVTLLLFVANRGNPFFLQQRPGKNGRIFKIIKFRTMSNKKDRSGNLLADELRLTPIGAFVRKISLDELPQLLNVIVGDMSLVGPRPLLPEYLPLYSSYHARRHEMRPGITGWAQVNGRNAISWTQKFDYDVWYIDHVSFLLDLQILIMTIKKVVIREGISSSTSATMQKLTSDYNADHRS